MTLFDLCHTSKSLFGNFILCPFFKIFISWYYIDWFALSVAVPLTAAVALAFVLAVAMASENPNALTWVFSYQVVDPADPSPELTVLKSLNIGLTQYLAYHVVEHSERHTVYIRAVIRFYKPRSLLQLKSLISGVTAKPLRGVFTQAVVSDKLRPINRVGPLYEFGSISPVSVKRSLDCSGLCSCCCLSNKRVAI